MFVRNRHVVVFGAQRAFGHRIVEALLALGAHVIAVAPLRTELEALRAELRQHHRLNVAECSSDEEGPRRLLEATLRRGHADGVVFVADDSAESLSEGVALSRALAGLSSSASPQVVFARPVPGHAGPEDDRLASAWAARELQVTVLYDASDASPAVSQMLTHLSPPPAS